MYCGKYMVTEQAYIVNNNIDVRNLRREYFE